MRVLCALVLVSLCVRSFSAEKLITDGVAVIVNDAIITYYDVNKLIEDDRELLRRQYARQPEVLRQRLSDVHAAATEMLIDRQLILHEYKTAGYKYPESIIEDSIEDRIKQKFHDRAELLKGLHVQGITYEMWRQQQREEILIVAMQQLKAPRDVLISPQKILDFYETNKTNFAVGEQVKLRMIVLNKTSTDKGEARQLAEEILRKIDEGASFAEMARIHSDGAQRNTGGDWGWADREHETLRKELADAAFKLNPGEKSGVIDLPDACWLILAEEKRSARVRPLPEVRDDIERTLRIMEATRVQKKWLKRLRDKAFVTYF